MIVSLVKIIDSRVKRVLACLSFFVINRFADHNYRVQDNLTKSGASTERLFPRLSNRQVGGEGEPDISRIMNARQIQACVAR